MRRKPGSKTERLTRKLLPLLLSTRQILMMRTLKMLFLLMIQDQTARQTQTVIWMLK
jgi:hypothetical protein